MCSYQLNWRFRQAVSDLTKLAYRIVGLSTETKNNAILDDDFRLTWRALMSGKPIQSHHGSTQVAAAAKPSIAILDASQPTISLKLMD